MAKSKPNRDLALLKSEVFMRVRNWLYNCFLSLAKNVTGKRRRSEPRVERGGQTNPFTSPRHLPVKGEGEFRAAAVGKIGCW